MLTKMVTETLTETEIREALRDCYDAEIPCNIVDLGLVREIAVRQDPDAPGTGIAGVPQKHLVDITITSTNTAEEAQAQIMAQIANRLAGLETVSRTAVTLVAEPRWTPQDITPAGRRRLGLDGNPALVQIR